MGKVHFALVGNDDDRFLKSSYTMLEFDDNVKVIAPIITISSKKRDEIIACIDVLLNTMNKEKD